MFALVLILDTPHNKSRLFFLTQDKYEIGHVTRTQIGQGVTREWQKAFVKGKENDQMRHLRSGKHY